MRNLGSLFWLQVMIVVALMVVLYSRVLADLANDWWTDPSLSQGLLIPPLALYIAWTRRNLTLAQPVRAANRGLWLIACACLLYILGRLGAEFFLPRLSFVILLAGLIWTFWGYGRLTTLAFPLLLLATMVPLPVLVYNSIAAPLQLFASDVATNLAQLLGVAVYRDGNVIHLAHISLGVEEACSGLNSLSALMVASLLLGFLVCQRVGIRVLLFALAIPLSIAVNVLRVTGTAVIADYREEFAMGFYHSFSGWLVFIGGFTILYGIAKGLDRLTRTPDGSAKTIVQPSPPEVASRPADPHPGRGRSMKKLPLRYIGTVLMLTATLGGYALSERRKPDFLAQPLDTIDKQIDGWTATHDEPLTTRVLDRLQLTSYISRLYQKQGKQLGLFVAFYAEQRAGESMHSPKHCLPGSGWEIWKIDSAMVPVSGGQVKINQYSIRNAGDKMLVFYWYQSKRRIIASEYMGKILLARDALFDGRTAGSIVRITLPDVPSAPAEGTAFASVVIPEVQRCFGEAN